MCRSLEMARTGHCANHPTSRAPRSARALTSVQRLDRPDDARCAGFRLLGFLHPAHPLFAVGIGQPIEESPRGVIAGERVREVGWDGDLPTLGVPLDID